MRLSALSAALLLGLVLLTIWGLKLARVTRSNVLFADHWSRPHGRPGGLLYVALGDSAAQGIGARRPERGYVGLLAQRLRDTTGREVEVVNLSRSGARMHDVIDSQTGALAALGRTPDVLTVAVGGNDMLAYDDATFRVNSDRLMAALPAGTYVADVPYFMHGHWERDAQHAAELLVASAVRHGHRPVFLHQALKAQGWQAMLNQFAADWFHPNDRGHRAWAEAFWSQIQADSAGGHTSGRHDVDPVDVHHRPPE
ncbi:MAG: SGNH/GDSL hydrolase family protein [Nocardioides sp.]|nr:SGNH/GDSL hydrolase family protein [Nocardioides sp.]